MSDVKRVAVSQKTYVSIILIYLPYRVGQIKRGQCSFLSCSEARFTEF